MASFDSLSRIILLKNGWYQGLKLKEGEFVGVFLYPIKTQYPFTNTYLKNRFVDKLDIPADVRLFNLEEESEFIDFKIYDSGRELVGVQLGTTRPIPTSVMWSVVLISSSILIFLVWWWVYIKSRFRLRKRLSILVFSIGVVLIRFGLFLLDFPGEVLPSLLWSPSLFAIPFIAPSLGELLLHVALLSLIVLFAFRQVNQQEFQPNRWASWMAVVLIAVLSASGVWLSRHLVVNSTLELDLSNFAVLNHHSIIALIVLAMYWGTLGLGIHLLIKNQLSSEPRRMKVIQVALAVILLIGFLFLLNYTVFLIISSASWLVVFLWLSGIGKLSNSWRWTYGGVVAWLLTLSILPAIALFEGNSQKQRLQQEAYAYKLVEQRDWYLELSLQILSEGISSDPYAQAIFTNPYIQPKDLRKRFVNLYFGGEFSRFDVDVHAFNPSGFELKRSEEVFLDQYQSLINRFGDPTPSEYFFYLNQPDVPQMYIGLIPISSDQKFLGNLVVECKPKVYQSNNVYPELLLEGTRTKSSWENRFASAIWKQGELSRKEGEIPDIWLFAADTISLEPANTLMLREGGFQTVFLMTQGRQLIMVFDKILQPKVMLSYFSYFACLLLFLFALFYGFELFGKVTGKDIPVKSVFQIGLRARINIALVSVILLSFLIIGVVTVSYFLEEFETYHKERLLRKQNAIESDIKVNLLGEESDSLSRLTGTAEELGQEVAELSVIHSMDINLFDISGSLIATSQPSIFEEGLISKRMNFQALNDLQSGKDETILDESIGGLDYISVYTPITSSSGQIVAYLHLPYFARERNLNRDISNFMVTLINAYVLLLILTGFLAILISRGVNRSLRSIAEKLGDVRITGQNEPIPVGTRDEIGLLVEEYNKMIRELESSARKLAETERESAWREMAKQIAHEIKNPLTPMKLSIQHLQRAMKSGDPGAQELAERVSVTLIEQIDNLSSIASAFSSFAKMPHADNELLDLKLLTEGVIELFKNEDVAAQFDFDSKMDRVLVYADKNQLISVLNNLIKNALQAVPDERKAKIAIRISDDKDSWLLAVKDNGSGIPDDLHSKVFVPNFTTKGSGSGLGLAIARRVIDQAEGKLWFETETDVGTTFFVRLPKAQNVES